LVDYSQLPRGFFFLFFEKPTPKRLVQCSSCSAVPAWLRCHKSWESLQKLASRGGAVRYFFYETCPLGHSQPRLYPWSLYL
jgi:hypothetical protein